MSSPARREQVALCIARGHSERRACELIGISRSALRRAPTLPAKDAPALAVMRRLASQYRKRPAITALTARAG